MCSDLYAEQLSFTRIVNNDFFAIFALERKYGVGIIRCAIGKASASLAQRRKWCNKLLLQCPIHAIPTLDITQCHFFFTIRTLHKLFPLPSFKGVNRTRSVSFISVALILFHCPQQAKPHSQNGQQHPQTQKALRITKMNICVQKQSGSPRYQRKNNRCDVHNNIIISPFYFHQWVNDSL